MKTGLRRTPDRLRRRRLVIGMAVLATPLLARAALRPTPAQTAGPFYPQELPVDHDADLLRGRFDIVFAGA